MNYIGFVKGFHSARSRLSGYGIFLYSDSFLRHQPVLKKACSDFDSLELEGVLDALMTIPRNSQALITVSSHKASRILNGDISKLTRNQKEVLSEIHQQISMGKELIVECVSTDAGMLGLEVAGESANKELARLNRDWYRSPY